MIKAILHLLVFLLATVTVLVIVIFKKDGLRLLSSRIATREIRDVTLSNYAILFVYVLGITIVSWIFYHLLQAFFAYLVSDHLSEFLLNSRAVYSIAAAKNFTFSVNGILMGLIFTPLSMFMATYCLMHLKRVYFLSINRLFDDEYAINEKDLNNYALIGITFFMLLEFALHYQATNNLTSDINSLYIAVDKYGFLIAFVFLKHCFRVSHDKNYVNALADTKEKNFQQWVFTNPIPSLLFAYFIIVLLRIPAFFGTQFIVSNWVVILCLVLFLAFLAFVYKRLLQNIALLTFQTLANEEKIIPLKPLPFDTNRFTLFFIGFVLVFGFVKFKIFFMLLFITIVGVFLVYAAASFLFLFTDWIQHFFSKQIDTGHKNLMMQYMAWLNLKTITPVGLFNLLMVLLFACFPKPFIENQDSFATSLVDENRNLLFVAKQSDETVCLPLAEVPEFSRRMLIAQEDQGFSKQRKLISTDFSNWHGISFSLYKLLVGKGGGSNINYQILKNNIWPANPPKDVVRKLSESLSSLQLSVQHSPEEILTLYFNGVSFNGGRGGTMGIESAAYYTFGKSVERCNELQQLFLITSLRSGSTYSLGQDGRIPLSSVKQEEQRVKAFLIRRAKELEKGGIISFIEFRKLSRQDLDIKNQLSFPKHTKSKNLYYQKLITQNNITPGEHQLTLRKQVEESIVGALAKFKQIKQKELVAKTGDSLLVSCIVVEIGSGEIWGQYNGDDSQDLVSYENGFPMASTIKPFVITSIAEKSGVAVESIRLYDGKKKSNVPKNYNNKYLEKEVGIDVIIPKSKNSPMAYINKYYEPLKVFEDTEVKFAKMGIPKDVNIDLTNKELKRSYERNYPLGQRLMRVNDIAKCYSSLLNRGEYVEHTVIQKKEIVPMKIYDGATTAQVTRAMNLTTLAGGTAHHLNRYLKKGKRYYAKTGTSENNIHGLCVLADEKVLVVAWASYGRIEQKGTKNARLELNQTASLQGGGSTTAGVFAALVLGEMGR